MRTHLVTAPGRHEHPPQPVEPSIQQVRRVGPLDRAALHLGLALVKWGRRPTKPDRPAYRWEIEQARREMERVRAEHAAIMLTRLR
jgi:hypothetical protein